MAIEIFTQTMYRASDGIVFDNIIACKKYEEKLEFTKAMKLKHGSVWICYNERRNGRINEAYSSHELAKKSLEFIDEIDRGNWRIEEINIDARFWGRNG